MSTANPVPETFGSHRLRRQGDPGDDRTGTAPPGRVRSTARLGRVQPCAFDGVRDLADHGAGGHRPGGTRERARVGAGERCDRRDAQGGLPGTGRRRLDGRGQAGARGRGAEPFAGSDARADRRHRHGDHAPGADRASDEPPLRCRAGPSDTAEVRPRVRAHDQRRSARGRRVHRDDARDGRRARCSTTPPPRMSGTSSAGRSRSPC